MKRKISALVVTAALLLAMIPSAFAAGSLSNFQKTETFRNGQFSDVSASHWAYSNVKSSYEYGLMNGQGNKTFAPNGSLTVAATITVAARIHSIYNTGSENFVQGSPWYQCYVDYALENGLIDGEYANYNAAIQRWEFAQILGRALPDTALQSINTVEDGAIPDVPASASFSADVYRLYRAGILTGSGADSKFSPYSGILRSEAAAIISRMVEPGLRKQFTLTNDNAAMTAKEVYQKTQNSVFYIEIYNASGKAVASGSGVFLTSSGVAVTNYHVIDGAYSARIKTNDGTWYDVKGVYGYDEDVDLAVLQISGSGFTPAEMGDSKNVSTGDTVYALGNPLGLESTFSDGIVSNPSRQVQGMTYIQVTAPISSGSSGGALFDDRGRLIGITTGAFTDGQNLNVAVPAYRIGELRQSGTVTALSTLSASNSSGTTGAQQGYKEYLDVPDIGAYCGMPLYGSNMDSSAAVYLYRLSDAPNGVDDLVMTHHYLLQEWGFTYYDQDYLGGILCNLYGNAQGRVVAVGITSYQGEECYMVAVA